MRRSIRISQASDLYPQKLKIFWLIVNMERTLLTALSIFIATYAIIGSVANLIVLEVTKYEVTISFIEYLKVGLPVTLLTLLVGVFLLT